METLQNVSVLLGSSWASGVNLYLTIAGLGIVDRLGLIQLPGNLDAISSTPVIIVALALFVIEFFADKIPYVDSMWDSVHTFIRPLGGTVLAYMAMAETAPAAQVSVALLCGAVSMDSHLTKATSRVAINTSPEPFTNWTASISEDILVLAVLWFVVKHPLIAGIFVVLFILFSLWFLKTMFRFVKKMFHVVARPKPENAG
jgi:hypothetical protein